VGAYVLAGDFPDEDLVQRCRDGEEDAFSELYRRYRCRVLSAAYRILRDPQEAQDATQEIFLKVHRALPGWEPGRSRLSTWLYRLASNHAVDRWRVQSRRRQIFPAGQRGFAVHLPLRVAGRVETPHDVLERKETAGRLQHCVDLLPISQRRVFILRHWHGLRLYEIARREGLHLGTVKSLLSRATQSVRRRLSRTRAA
jgi:RNA polymerase sigma-70 factor (ECF subfamily)